MRQNRRASKLQSGLRVEFVPGFWSEGTSGSWAGKPTAPPLSNLPVVSRKVASSRQGCLTCLVFSKPRKRWHEASRVASDHTPNLRVLWLLNLPPPWQGLAAGERLHTTASKDGQRGSVWAESCCVHISWTGALQGGASELKAPRHPCKHPLFLPSFMVR